MSINLKPVAAALVSGSVTISQAMQIATQVISLIAMAEQVFDGLKGDVKFQAVMSGLDAVLADLNLADQAAALKAKIGPAINLLVKLINLAGLWKSLLPDVDAATPVKAA